MQLGLGPRIRHPLFPGLHAIPARDSSTCSTALHGTFQELLRAARKGARVRRAVFLTCTEGEPLPAEAERNTLWELFRVPVFAVLLDRKGRVLAYECEAQSGMHLNGRYAAALADTVVCDCGRPGRKLPARAMRPVARALAG